MMLYIMVALLIFCSNTKKRINKVADWEVKNVNLFKLSFWSLIDTTETVCVIYFIVHVLKLLGWL